MVDEPSLTIIEGSECRKVGYSIYSAFEEDLRDYISNLVQRLHGEKWKKYLPEGVILSICEKLEREGINYESISDLRKLLEFSDFPHLKEILINRKYQRYISDYAGNITITVFIKNMDEINNLRNKIAHVKRNFSDYHVNRLLSYVDEISQGKKATKIRAIISGIKEVDVSELQDIPVAFLISEKSKCPDNLPSPDYEFDGGFIGRKTSISRLKEMLYGDLDRVITISGAGGVGKTALAQRVAYDILDDRKNPFDGMVWVSAKEEKLTPHGIESIDFSPAKTYELLLQKIIETLTPEIYESLLKILSDSIKSNERKIMDNEEFVRALLEKNSYLIVVDNLESIKDERVIKFIKDIPRPHKVLITSRIGLGEVERRYNLKELTESEAVSLFRVISRDKSLKQLYRSNNSVILKYVNKVQRYPLAIKWCLGQIALGKDIQKVFSTFEEPSSDLVTFCFNDIFNILSNDAKKILYGISLFDESPSITVLRHLVNLDSRSFELEIRNLILTSLVIPEQIVMGEELVTKYYMLTLTKSYITNKLSQNIGLSYELYDRKNEIESDSIEVEKAKALYQYSLFGAEPETEKEKIALIKCQTAYNFSQSNNYNEAINELNGALAITPSYTTVYRYYAIIEADYHHIDHANEMMKKATEIEPNNDFLWYIWGNINKKHGRTNDAKKYLENAIKYNQNDLMYYYTYGYILRDLGKYEQSYGVFVNALNKENDPQGKIMGIQGLSDTLRKWSRNLYKRHKFTDAIKKIDESHRVILKGIEIDDNDWELNTTYKYIILDKGFVYSKRKGYEHGKEYLLKCMEEMKNIHKRKERTIKAKACFYLLIFMPDKLFDNIHEINDYITFADTGLSFFRNNSTEYKQIRIIRDRLLKNKQYLEKIRMKTKGVVTHYDREKHFGFVEIDGISYFFRTGDFDVFVDTKLLDGLVGSTIYFDIKMRDQNQYKNDLATNIIPQAHILT